MVFSPGWICVFPSAKKTCAPRKTAPIIEFSGKEIAFVEEGEVEAVDNSTKETFTIKAGEKLENNTVTEYEDNEIKEIESEVVIVDRVASSSSGCLSLILGFLIIGGAGVILFKK